MTILPLSSCGKNVSPQSIANTAPVETTTSTDLDRFIFRKKDKLGFIDRNGKIIIPAQFDRIDEDFSEGLAAVSIGDKWGYINPMGKVVISLKFNQALSFQEGLGAISIKNKGGSHEWGYIDQTGKIAIPPQFQTPGRFEHGLAYIYTGNESSSFTIDKTGKVVATPSPNPAKEATKGESDGLRSFEENNKYGYKDRTGKIVIPAKFDRVGFYPGYFNDGLAPACLNKKCGYIDKTGKIVIPFQFDLVADKFSDGLAWVNINKKLGYINKTGKFIIPARYRQADIGKGVCMNPRPCLNGTGLDSYPDFDRGLAIVAIPNDQRSRNKKSYRAGYIDTTGKLVFEF
jgi:WG containing repeat